VENELPTVFTFSLDYIKTHRTKLISLIKTTEELKVNEVYVAYDRTTIYTPSGKAALPPLSKLSPLVLGRLKKLYSGMEGKQMEVLITSDGIAVVKEKERER